MRGRGGAMCFWFLGGISLVFYGISGCSEAGIWVCRVWFGYSVKSEAPGEEEKQMLTFLDESQRMSIGDKERELYVIIY